VTNIVERADVRVVEAGDGFRLALKSLACLRSTVAVFRQNLDGDCAVEAAISGLVDLAHAPHADRRENLVRAKARVR
jgi:hypothetical protein